MTHARPSIVLDCDPGIDDAFAIFCCTRFCDLQAITTVSGNVTLDNTTRNALHLVHMLGTDTPVHRGASVPLQVAPAFAADVHGASGLGATPTPPPPNTASAQPAVDALLELSTAAPLTLVATGPLTNVALALQADTDFASRIDHIYWMGGSTGPGNVTERAEFNAWADPHAVDVTFRSGVPLTMFGLNLTHQVRMSGGHASALRSAGSATALAAAEYLEFYETNGHQDGNGQPMHDPCAVLGFTHDALFTTTSSHIVVETADEATRGWTRVVDVPETQSSEIVVAETAQAPDVIALIMEAAISPISEQ